MSDWSAVRGFLIGLVLAAGLAISVLSLRPGGLRHSLLNAARRLRLALLLAGAYLVAAAAAYVVRPPSPWAEVGMTAIGLGLVGTFLVVGRDRPLPPPASHAPSRRLG